jgi:hypothetical protein
MTHPSLFLKKESNVEQRAQGFGPAMQSICRTSVRLRIDRNQRESIRAGLHSDECNTAGLVIVTATSSTLRDLTIFGGSGPAIT